MATGPGYALGEIAHVLNARLEGDPTRIVTGVAPLESAGPGEISFLIDARHRAAARASRAGALVAEPGVDGLPAAVLRTARPQQALIDLLRLFHPPAPRSPGVHPTAVVAADVRIDATAGVGPLAVIEAGATVGPRVRIHALVYVGPGVEIGEDSEIHPHVALRGGVRLGRRVVIHAGAVLGADGFGYAFDGQQHRKIPQVDGVVVEDDVEIGANTTIDRAMLGNTRVRRGAKLDNLVQVGHNVDVGEHAILVAQVGVSGSTRLGRGVVLAGQVGWPTTSRSGTARSSVRRAACRATSTPERGCWARRRDPRDRPGASSPRRRGCRTCWARCAC